MSVFDRVRFGLANRGDNALRRYWGQRLSKRGTLAGFSAVLPVLASCVALVVMSCSSNKSNDQAVDFEQLKQNFTDNNLEQYDRSFVSGPLGSVELFSLNPEYFKRERAKLESRSLYSVPLSSEYNTEAFVLDGEKSPHTVLLRPAVFLRSAVPSERAQIQQSTDGTTKVPVSIALTDGMAPELFTGKGTRVLPREFLIKDKTEFISALEAALHQKPIFVSSVRCPTELKLIIEGLGEFEVEFKSKTKNCQMNIFFPAQIVLKTEKWKSVLLAFAEGRKVEVESKLNLSNAMVIHYARFNLSKKAVREHLNQTFKDVITPISVEQLSGAQKVLLEAIEGSFKLSFPNEMYLRLQDEILRENFTIHFSDRCPDKIGPCFLWREEPLRSANQTYEFDIRQEEFVGKPLFLKTRSPVLDYLNEYQEFTLKASQDNPLEPPKAAEVNQLFRTIREGEIAEFQIRHFELGEIDLAKPKTEHTSNKICLDPYALCLDGDWKCINPHIEPGRCREECTGGYEDVCYFDEYTEIYWDWELGPIPIKKCGIPGARCRSWSKVCDERRVCERLKKPNAPSLPVRNEKVTSSDSDFSWNCTKYADNQCDPDKWADHWQRVTTWSFPMMTPRLHEILWKKEYWDRAIDGLSVKFSWATVDGTETLTCPLSALEHRVVTDNRLLIFFHNTIQCQPFNDQTRKLGYGPSIGLINNISFPSEFQCGSMTENWEGKRRYICRVGDKPETSIETTATDDEKKISIGERLGIYQPYYPPVEIQGQLRIVGSYLERGVENL